MAKITLSDAHPGGEGGRYFDFPYGVIDLTEADSFETENAAVISDARVHPWLTVENSTDTPAPAQADPPVAEGTPVAVVPPSAPTPSASRGSKTNVEVQN